MQVDRDKKSKDVLRQIRQRIVQGEYPPGFRLPTRQDIGRQFGVSVATVQRALDVLKLEGFIRTGARKAGTHVVDRPPHLHNFGLVAWIQHRWSRYYTAICQAAKILEASDHIGFIEYPISRGASGKPEVPGLSRDVHSHRVGGVAFADVTAGFEAALPIPGEDMPCVLLQPAPAVDIPAVFLDYDSFQSRAVEYLLSQGRRRIAHLRVGARRQDMDVFERSLARMGLEFRPYWAQYMHVEEVHESAANVVHLMMQLEGDKRPQALIIYDDNLVEQAVWGLMAAGTKVPDDLAVVAHFNYPTVAPTGFPLKWLGFDCRVLLREALKVLNMQRSGLKPPASTAIPAIFKEELEEEMT